MPAQPRILAAAVLATLVCALPASARDLPPALREAVRRGAGTVELRGASARIGLIPSPVPGSPGPYVRILLNGRGPFVFVFDTGATVTIIDADIARSAGIPVVFHRERNSIVHVRDVQMGSLHLRDEYAFENSGLKAGIGADGVLGFNAFGTFPFAVDRAALTVFATLPDIARQTRVSLLEDHSGWRITAVPLIPMTTQTTTIPTLIDTGDDGWIDLLPDDVKGLPLLKPMRAAHVEYNPNSGQTRSMLGQAAAPFRLAGASIESPVFRTDPSLPVSDVGWPLLVQFFPIVFDRARAAVYFSAPNRPPTTPVLRTLPFRMRFARGGATVSDIIPETTAVADLAIGDRIESIDGRAAGSFDAGSLAELLARSSAVHIAWVHAGVAFSREIPVLTLP